MSLEIIEHPIILNEEWDASKLLLAKTANNDLKVMADALRNSPKVQLDPNDGRKMIITLTADVNGLKTDIQRILP